MRRIALVLAAVLYVTPLGAQTVTPQAVDRAVERAAQSTRLNDALLVIGGGLCGADLAVSMDAFARGQAREANPALRPFVGHPVAFGAVKSGADTAAILWLRSQRQEHPRRTLWLTVGYVVWKAAVVGWNVHALSRPR